MLGKTPLTKKAHKKNSHPKAGLMAGRRHLANLGKMAQEERASPGQAWLFIEEGG
jgi:hypothetical protein